MVTATVSLPEILGVVLSAGVAFSVAQQDRASNATPFGISKEYVLAAGQEKIQSGAVLPDVAVWAFAIFTNTAASFVFAILIECKEPGPPVRLTVTVFVMFEWYEILCDTAPSNLVVTNAIYYFFEIAAIAFSALSPAM